MATQKAAVETIIVEKDRREAITKGQTEEEKHKQQIDKKLADAEKLYKELTQIAQKKGVGPELLSAISKGVNAGQAVLYKQSQNHYQITETFAFFGETKDKMYEVGEGLVGQAGKICKTLYINEVPNGYTTIISGLGDTHPKALSILPLCQENEITAPFVIEAAFLNTLDDADKHIIDTLLEKIQEALAGGKAEMIESK